MKKILSFLFIGLLAFVLVACGKEVDPNGNITYSISINEADKNITLDVDATKLISVTFEGDEVVWEIDNPEIASIKDGLITALKEGTAVITVSLKDHTEYKVTINVTVNKKQETVIEVAGIAIAGKKTEVEVGTEFTISAVVTPTNATDKTITWASSDATVASVENGKVKALKVGTTEISAKAGDKEDKFTLTVKEATPEVVLATDIVIDPGVQIFHIGDTDVAYAEVDPEATDQTIVWSTSDPNVVTIDDSGLITAVGGGKADIIATTHDGTNLSDSYKVVVYADVTEMTISGESEMALNGTQKLTVTVNSDSASDLTWSSSDDTIASVVANTGFVTALKEGTVTIKCKSGDRTGMEKEFTITIKEIVVTAIDIKGEHGMSPNTEQTLVATGNVDSHPTFKWTSSDPETATVDDNGKVTAIKEGTVKITCEVQDSGKFSVEFEISIVNKVIKIGETEYDTISAAIAAAKAGDVIEIGAGTYNETITIDKDGLTIKGPNATIPGFLDRGAEAIITGAVTVKANDTKFIGMKFSGAGTITLGEKGSTGLVDGVLFYCCYIESTPIQAEGCNRYGSVVNASATANVTFEKTYMNCGTNTTQRSNIAMAQKMTNLTIYDCVLHQDATSPGTCEAIMTYNVDGRFEITNSTIENTTSNFLLQLGYNNNTCTYVLIKDNVWSAKDKTLDTAGLNLKNMLENTKIDFIHNYIYNAKGNTFSFANNKETSVVNVMFNYFNEGTSFKLTSKGNGTLNFENNYYAASQTTATEDAGKIGSLEELEAAYAKWNELNSNHLIHSI